MDVQFEWFCRLGVGCRSGMMSESLVKACMWGVPLLNFSSSNSRKVVGCSTRIAPLIPRPTRTHPSSVIRHILVRLEGSGENEEPQ